VIVVVIRIVWENGVAPIATADAKAARVGGSWGSYSTFFGGVKTSLQG
jgi:hypothetical protein